MVWFTVREKGRKTRDRKEEGKGIQRRVGQVLREDFLEEAGLVPSYRLDQKAG